MGGTVRGGDGGECGAVGVVPLQKEDADKTALRGGPIRFRCQQCLILFYCFILRDDFAIICHYITPLHFFRTSFLLCFVGAQRAYVFSNCYRRCTLLGAPLIMCDLL